MSGRKPGSNALRISRIIELWNMGTNAPEIGRQVGCSKQNVYSILQKRGLYTREKREPYIDRGKIKALYDADRSISWIADDMGLDGKIIGQVIKELHENGEIA